MARRRSGRKNTPQAKRFGAAVRACWAEARGRGGYTSPKQLGSCMRGKLKKKRRRKGRR